MEKVTGIGGIFFHARDPEKLGWWYEKHLGIKLTPRSFEEAPWHQEAGPTSFMFTEFDESRGGPVKQFQMMTFRVRNLDVMVAQLRAASITVTIHKSDTQPDGRSATAFDPEGNAVELWEPRGSRNITVSAATLADIPLLADMMAEFYTEAAIPLDRARAGASFAALLVEPSRGAVWIVYDDTQPAGYAVLTVRFSMEHGGPDAFIDDLFIRPTHRRRGLGRAALKELFADCRRRSVVAIHVEVRPDNTTARSFYASCGLALRADKRELLTVWINAEAKLAGGDPEDQTKGGRKQKGKTGQKRRSTYKGAGSEDGRGTKG